jgi:hypothetical protein
VGQDGTERWPCTPWGVGGVAGRCCTGIVTSGGQWSDPEGEAAYDEHLAGREVLATLRSGLAEATQTRLPAGFPHVARWRAVLLADESAVIDATLIRRSLGGPYRPLTLTGRALAGETVWSRPRSSTVERCPVKTRVAGSSPVAAAANGLLGGLPCP